MKRPEDAQAAASRRGTIATDPVDLDIVDAIQLDPRAPWSKIAGLVGVSEATVSRRWHRLRESGLAWSGAALHPEAGAGALLEIRCWSDAHDSLIAELGKHPDVITIGSTTGDFNVFAIVMGVDLSAVLRRVYDGLPELTLADRVRVSLIHRVFGGVNWRQGLLKVPAAQSGARIRSATPPGEETAATQEDPVANAPLPPSRELRPLFLELATDARLPVRELARRLGTSVAVVTRQLNDLHNDHGIIYRCDVARPDFDYQVGILVLLKVPVLEAEKIARMIGTWIETRFCTATAGTANVIVIAGLRDLPDSDRFLNELARIHTNAEVLESRIVTRNKKVYGWHLDDTGRTTGCTPADPWAMS